MTHFHKPNRALVAGAAALSLILAGCGSDSPPAVDPPPPPVPVDMSNVTATPGAGTLNLNPGTMGTLGDVSYMCASGEAGCMVTVDAAGARYTGGMVTAMNSYAYDLHAARTAHAAAIDNLNSAHMAEIGNLTSSHQAEIASLNATHMTATGELTSSHQAEIASLNATHMTATGELTSSHQAEIASLNATHMAAIGELTSSHQAEIASLNATHMTAIDDLTTAHQTATADLTTAHQTAITDLEAAHRADIERLESTDEENIAQLERDHQTAIANLNTAHQTAIANLNTAHQTAMNNLNTAHQTAISGKDREIADKDGQITALKKTYSDELTAAETAAMTAKDAAASAYSAADADASAAEAAVANRAAIQTSSLMVDEDGMEMNATTYAMKARDHAVAAGMASADAMTAYNTAMSATTITDAVMARGAAETAQGMADDHAMKASAKKTSAMMAADMDVLVDDSGADPAVSVGGVTIIDDGVLVADGGTGTPIMSALHPKEKTGLADQRMLRLGTTYMTTDTRLDVVDSYKSEMPVMWFRDRGAGHRFRTGDPDFITIVQDIPDSSDDAEDGDTIPYTQTVPLTKAKGMYWMATTGGRDPWKIADDAEGEKLYSYIHTAPDGSRAEMRYVRFVQSFTMAGGLPTWVYQGVVTNAEMGPMGRAAEKLPVPNLYDHLSFGMWADQHGSALNPDYGVAFVHEKGTGMGMTPMAGMPVRGQATYTGNYVARVWNRGSGRAVTMPVTETDTAEMTAYFGRGLLPGDMDDMVEVKLEGLMGSTKLMGAIDGSMFGGNDDVNVGTMTAPDMYVGSFTGSFFGSAAEEAGGVFKYMSMGDGMNIADGATGWFHGSFGAVRPTVLAQ